MRGDAAPCRGAAGTRSGYAHGQRARHHHRSIRDHHRDHHRSRGRSSSTRGLRGRHRRPRSCHGVERRRPAPARLRARGDRGPGRRRPARRGAVRRCAAPHGRREAVGKRGGATAPGRKSGRCAAPGNAAGERGPQDALARHLCDGDDTFPHRPPRERRSCGTGRSRSSRSRWRSTTAKRGLWPPTSSCSGALGKTQEEMRGLTLWEIEPQPPFDEIDRLQRQVLHTGEILFREYTALAPGETRRARRSMFLSPLKDGAGTVQGLSALVIDTTEQYWARRRLAVLNDASLRIGSTPERDPHSRGTGRGGGDRGSPTSPPSTCWSPSSGVTSRNRYRPTGPVVFRRAAQRSVLPGCPESVVAPGEHGRLPSGTHSRSRPWSPAGAAGTRRAIPLLRGWGR